MNHTTITTVQAWKISSLCSARAKLHLSLPWMVLTFSTMLPRVGIFTLQCLSDRITVTLNTLLVIFFPVIGFSLNSGGVLLYSLFLNLPKSSTLHCIRYSSGISLRAGFLFARHASLKCQMLTFMNVKSFIVQGFKRIY